MQTVKPVSARRRRLVAVSFLLLSPLVAPAQNSPDLRAVMERLERLEQANRALTEEVRALRSELAAARPATADSVPTVDEKLAVVDARIAEQAQSKVEASQKFPVRLTGMALFNAYLNSANNGGSQYPLTATQGTQAMGGATLRQSVIGLLYSGPQTVWGGKVRGSLFMDMFGGSGQSLDQLVRLRTGTIAIDWRTRGIAAGLEKPIFAPREPASLAQVGVSPLTGSGNLWLWVPQVRFEQDFRFGDHSGVRAQAGVVQTRESYTPLAGGYVPVMEKTRPGYEGRFEFFHGAERRIEIAPGFHASTSHIDGVSVPSNLFSLDWFMNPWKPVEFTGAFFTGQNVAPLGTGGAGGGINIPAYGKALPIHALGGWGQLTYRATSRLSFNLFTGQQDNRNSDVEDGRVGKNLSYGANFYYKLAPNVILSFETSQVRTSRIRSSTVLNNHYDLALAYLF